MCTVDSLVTVCGKTFDFDCRTHENTNEWSNLHVVS